MLKEIDNKKTKGLNQKNSNYYDLEQLSFGVIERIDDVLIELGITEFELYPDRVSFACPIHGGDNSEGASILTEGVGNWQCFTHGCHNKCGKSVLGFIAGVLSDEPNFGHAVKWVAKFLDAKPTGAGNRDSFLSYYSKNKSKITECKYDKSILKGLEIPSPYFLRRGFSREVLTKYDVGLCMTKGRQMYKRSVVPIYDNSYESIIGCTGRSIYEQCPKCKCFHYDGMKCPDNKGLYRKWRNNKGFQGESVLYNYWFAKEHIENSMTAIVVEGQGDVWALEEVGIHNSVGVMGDSLNPGQLDLLNKTGVINLIFALDNDDAGIRSRENIYNQCCDLYNIRFLELPSKDFGDMKLEDRRNFIKKSL